MNERAKITASHLARHAVVYRRQSSAAQVEHHRESTERQYALASKARERGWPAERIVVIDEDLGLSGGGTAVALARVGLVLGLQVSRLARNNAEWYRLIDLAGLTDTLIGDGDGLYHPAVFNDRLLLGLKGTMSEAELHILRARLNGGIRNKAARGELRRGLPVGFVWGEEEGEVCCHPDEAVCTAIRQVFAQFAETGSARRVWLWFRSEGLKFPLQMPCPGSGNLAKRCDHDSGCADDDRNSHSGPALAEVRRPPSRRRPPGAVRALYCGRCVSGLPRRSASQ
jgi:DNA invertase Pin-like site-specific DNA recombinase